MEIVQGVMVHVETAGAKAIDLVLKDGTETVLAVKEVHAMEIAHETVIDHAMAIVLAPMVHRVMAVRAKVGVGLACHSCVPWTPMPMVKFLRTKSPVRLLLWPSSTRMATGS
jgi:hypothetical protein